MRLRPLTSLCFALLLGSCTEATLDVYGAVRGTIDGAPIPGATVSHGLGTTTTDARGAFVLPADGGPIRVSAEGYISVLRLRTTPGHSEQFTLWPIAPDDDAVDAHLARLEAARALRDDPDDPALSLRARARLRGEAPPLLDDEDGSVGAARLALEAPPSTIRIWRRSIDGASESCAGRIDVIPFEEYIAGVLPHEWIASWHDESLRAGALTIRTYAWQWVRAGGKYDCADLDDTARSQVYRDDRTDRATAAVSDTTGMAITVDGELVSGEYSAENGDPAAFGVADPLCVGFEIRGHRRGMCQWGSQRWALDGREHAWIAAHYFPGSVIEGGAASAGDYDARLNFVEAPTSLVSGQSAQVTFELDNTGRREWTAEGTRLGVTDAAPSPFFDGVSWVDELTATGPDAYRYPPSAAGRFTFVITAPEVSEPRLVEDQLQLSHEGFGIFGPELTLSIEVLPQDDGMPPPPPPEMLDGGTDSPPPPPGDGDGLMGGCSASGPAGAPAGGFSLLLALALGFRRRTWA